MCVEYLQPRDQRCCRTFKAQGLAFVGAVIVASAARGAKGFAPFPGPGEKRAEIAKKMSIIRTKAVNPMSI